jgi:hypothetical protein
MSEVKIYIGGPHGWASWSRRLITGLALTMAPIGVGIACGSTAMQWLGFVMGILILLVAAKADADRTTFSNTAEARAHLDKIDARQP